MEKLKIENILMEREYSVESRIFQLLPSLSPCPKCGKHPVSLRHANRQVNPWQKRAAVCCGSESCRFYIDGDTDEEVVTLWEEYNR